MKKKYMLIIIGILIILGNINIVAAESSKIIYDNHEKFEKFKPTDTYFRAYKFPSFDGKFEWNLIGAREASDASSDFTIDGKGVILRNSETDNSSIRGTVTTGIGHISVDLKKAYTGTETRQLGLFIDGERIAMVKVPGDGSIIQMSEYVKKPGAVEIEIKPVYTSKKPAEVTIDNIKWTNYKVFNVEFVMSEGLHNADIESTVVEDNTKLKILPEIVADDNYEHIGWIADKILAGKETGTILTDEDILNTSIVEDITFTAVSKFTEPDKKAPEFKGIEPERTYYVGDVIDLCKDVYAIDDVDGEINFTVEPTFIDSSFPSNYDVLYTATDKAGNKFEVKSIITVIEKQEYPVLIRRDDNADLGSFLFLSQSQNVVASVNTVQLQTLSSIPWTNHFWDVSTNDWFYDGVEYAYRNALMKGTSQNLFSPGVNVNRGMFVEILYRLSGSPAITINSKFHDVSSTDYYAKAVAWGSGNGIIRGISETEFGANLDMSREQLVTLLYRYAGYIGLNTSNSDSISGYRDSDNISSWASDAFRWAVSEGIVHGLEDGNLSPKGNATRAQVAIIMERFSNLYQ